MDKTLRTAIHLVSGTRNGKHRIHKHPPSLQSRCRKVRPPFVRMHGVFFQCSRWNPNVYRHARGILFIPFNNLPIEKKRKPYMNRWCRPSTTGELQEQRQGSTRQRTKERQLGFPGSRCPRQELPQLTTDQVCGMPCGAEIRSVSRCRTRSGSAAEIRDSRGQKHQAWFGCLVA